MDKTNGYSKNSENELQGKHSLSFNQLENGKVQEILPAVSEDANDSQQYLNHSYTHAQQQHVPSTPPYPSYQGIWPRTIEDVRAEAIKMNDIYILLAGTIGFTMLTFVLGIIGVYLSAAATIYLLRRSLQLDGNHKLGLIFVAFIGVIANIMVAGGIFAIAILTLHGTK